MRDLPAGTVTFVFTDIEGSTRLLHELGDEYAAALAEHRRLVRDAFARHGGIEVDTQGDAFFYAFARATDAAAAAAAAQRSLEHGPVRVRMGIHTGEPTVTEEGYVGADVHIGARVAAAGHGGQVLVSEKAAALLEDGLRDLGLHRLKDVGDAIRLYQLGDGAFPPLKTLNQSNLPARAEPLLGRERELDDLLRVTRNGETRLVTITGAGGIGKTRLAVELAAALVEQFAHGVWLVDLAPLRDPTLVLPNVARTLGVHGDVVEHVRERRLLLVLDNFEHVIDAAPEVARLLGAAPEAAAVVTSREPLRVGGEREYPLRPLAESSAVELFRRRAAAVEPGFDAGYAEIAGVCTRLDGLPLAIELAAARVKTLGLERLRERLGERLPTLTGVRRDVHERQRTLRATIAWSHELLAEDESRLFRRLAVFAGGFTAEAAEEICDADLDVVASLVDKSLVRFEGGRYSLLETIWEYALEQLQQAGERDLLRRRHAEWFLALASKAELTPYVHFDPTQQTYWLDRLEGDRDNFRVAIEWSLETDAELAVALVSGVFRLWFVRGPQLEVERWLRNALDRASDAPQATRASTLALASLLARTQFRLEEAERLADEGASIAAELGDATLQARFVNILTVASGFRGDFERARELCRRAIALGEQADNRFLAAFAPFNLAEPLLDHGRHREAIELLEQASSAMRELGAAETSVCVGRLGQALVLEGRDAEAVPVLREGLAIAARLGFRTVAGWTMVALAAVAARAGDAQRASRLVGAADTIAASTGARAIAADRLLREAALAGGEDSTALAEGRALDFADACTLALDDAP